MKALTIALTALFLTAPVVATAADKVTHLSFEAGVAAARKAGLIDGSVKFYLAGTGPRGRIVNDNVTINRKTNAFGKSDEETCN
ncbi:MAG: excinuclease, partial [Rhodanobacter sp.]